MAAKKKGPQVSVDMDGTILDSWFESYRLVSMAWPNLMNGDRYPLEPDEFRLKVRPVITAAGDFFSFTKALADGENLDIHNLDDIRQRYRQLEADGYRHLMDARRAVRNDFQLWMSLVPLYDGAKEMLDELASMPVDLYIISSKDGETIRHILQYYMIELPENRILDANHGRRPNQLRELRSMGYRARDMVMYDDSSENLAAAKHMRICAVAAPQGYDLPERIRGYRQALPGEFPGVARELLHL